MAAIVKKILIVLLPLIFMVAAYLAFDPFEVLYPHDTHYTDPLITYNWDYNQTDTLIRHFAERRYDSFIFGNSRSKAFLTGDWQGHIDSRNVFHYAALAETLYGVEKKIRFIDSRNIPIKNCLLVFDPSLLAVTWNSTGYMFIKHPAISGDSWVDFHLTFFRAFIDPHFFPTYLERKICGVLHPQSTPALVANAMIYDPITGDLTLAERERLIREDARKYFSNPVVFCPRDFTVKRYSPPVIKDPQLVFLRKIKEILTARKTRYKVVVTPNYDLSYLDRGDLEQLRVIFGRDNVFDYSGINDYTRDIHNFYENSHFRPVAARRILDEIYSR